MFVRRHITLATLPFALITALVVGSVEPVAGQVAAGHGEPHISRDAAGPERTVFPRPRIQPVRPPALGALTSPVGEATGEGATHRPRHLTVPGAGNDPAPRQVSRPWGINRILDVAIVAVGGSLVVGALTDYAAGPAHWGMTPSELGAFGVGATLAAWGGVRVGSWGSGGR